MNRRGKTIRAILCAAMMMATPHAHGMLACNTMSAAPHSECCCDHEADAHHDCLDACGKQCVEQSFDQDSLNLLKPGEIRCDIDASPTSAAVGFPLRVSPFLIVVDGLGTVSACRDSAQTYLITKRLRI